MGGQALRRIGSDLRSVLDNDEIDVFLIRDVANNDEIRDLFIRLQSGTALTRQQIRDAWPGNVGPFVERLAGKMKKVPAVQLFSLVDRRGMKTEDQKDRYDSDRQFCAQLLALFMARERDPLAQQGIGAEELDKLYHDNTAFPADGPAAARFQQILENTTKIFMAAVARLAAKSRMKKKFKKLDVISSFLLVEDLSRTPNFRFDEAFYETVAKHIIRNPEVSSVGKSTSGRAISDYYEEWRSHIVTSLGIRLDSQRAFDDQQRTEIYARDNGKCQICRKEIAHSDAE